MKPLTSFSPTKLGSATAIVCTTLVCLTATLFSPDNMAEHWEVVAHDLFSEWIYDACGSHENANIYWDDMYFNCKVELNG